MGTGRGDILILLKGPADMAIEIERSFWQRCLLPHLCLPWTLRGQGGCWYRGGLRTSSCFLAPVFFWGDSGPPVFQKLGVIGQGKEASGILIFREPTCLGRTDNSMLKWNTPSRAGG